MSQLFYLPIVVPEDKGGVEVERSGLYETCEVDGTALLYVPLPGAQDDCLWLDHPEVDPVLQVRGDGHLAGVVAAVARLNRLDHQPPLVATDIVVDLEQGGNTVYQLPTSW